MVPFKQTLLAGVAVSAMAIGGALASDVAADTGRANEEIVVTGVRASSALKTDTPILQTPQPITVIKATDFLSQGAVSISDTLNYVAGIQANPYGPDSRVDGGKVRGINPLQFRDGMRDIFSYYASIRSDVYNFSQVEVVRGPASVLFGSGSIGGIINMVSKVPQAETAGEISVRYGSFDNKEIRGDVTGTIAPGLAGRLVALVRDSDTQTEYVRDDRVMVAPSLRWQPGDDTTVTFIGLYQDDKTGSTSQFLPLVGTILPNPNGKLRNSLFVGKPGYDRYDGRLLQGAGIIEHQFNDAISVNLKARYIDSNLDYFTHYADSYSNPTNPYLDAAQRIIGMYADSSYASLDIFSSDNNLKFNFNTGEAFKHVVLAGVDYSWNRVRKTGGFDYFTVDLYNINYAAIPDYGGGLPTTFGLSIENTSQKQLGFYVQDQIRMWDRASLVLGLRRDRVKTQAAGAAAEIAKATSKRAGLIVEVVDGVSPFVSYTESFDPISGLASNGNPYKPKRGRQVEAGVKLHPSDHTLVTATGYHIKETMRPVDDPSTPNPFDQRQAGSMTSKGFEIEAKYNLPGNFDILANYSFVEAEVAGEKHQVENTPKHNASVWATKTFELGDELSARVGGGVRYSSANYSYGGFFPNGIRTPGYALVDGLIEVTRKNWVLALNATNLMGKEFYSACLSRGDCFNGAERKVYATLTYKF